MGALRLDSARPFDAKIEIHCAKYFKISVATPRPLKFSFSTNSRKLAEQKNPQPVDHIRALARSGGSLRTGLRTVGFFLHVTFARRKPLNYNGLLP
jgi:hypothetical protein